MCRFFINGMYKNFFLHFILMIYLKVCLLPPLWTTLIEPPAHIQTSKLPGINTLRVSLQVFPHDFFHSHFCKHLQCGKLWLRVWFQVKEQVKWRGCDYDDPQDWYSEILCKSGTHQQSSLIVSGVDHVIPVFWVKLGILT